MAKVIICLIISAVCAFLSYDSFMTNDYRPLQNWLAYYQEYKEVQGALNKGNASKAELFEKLKKMYPEKAKQWESQFRDKYDNLQDSARSTENSLTSRSEDTTTSRKAETTQSTQKQTRNSTTQRTNNQNNKANQ